MPSDVATCPHARLIITRLTGSVEVETILSALDAVDHLARDHCMRSVLIDGRSISSLAIGPSEVDVLARRISTVGRRIGPGRTALLAERSIDKAMVKLLLLQAAEGARQRRRFECEEDALAWLFEDRASRLEAASAALDAAASSDGSSANAVGAGPRKA